MFVFEQTPKVVALGGSTLERIRGREVVAESKVTIRVPDSEALENCLHQLEVSDRRLAEMGPKTGGYDWQFVMSESFDDGSAAVHFGVAWYDMDFFQEKKEIFKDVKHSRMLGAMGVSAAEISVDHWVKAA